MQDRELLELAAKAAGIEPFDWDSFPLLMIGDGPDYWNPLTDDGDALRLAVKLRLSIGWDEFNGVEYAEATPRGTYQGFDSPADGDPAAATRRAIVLAAAEIGKQANN